MLLIVSTQLALSYIETKFTLFPLFLQCHQKTTNSPHQVIATSHSWCLTSTKQAMACTFYLSLPSLPNYHSFLKTLPVTNTFFLSSFKQLAINLCYPDWFDPWNIFGFYLANWTINTLLVVIYVCDDLEYMVSVSISCKIYTCAWL